MKTTGGDIFSSSSGGGSSCDNNHNKYLDETLWRERAESGLLLVTFSSKSSSEEKIDEMNKDHNEQGLDDESCAVGFVLSYPREDHDTAGAAAGASASASSTVDNKTTTKTMATTTTYPTTKTSTTRSGTSSDVWHIWLAGVSIEYRGMGIWNDLLSRTMSIARSRVYELMSISTFPRKFPIMYKSLLKKGFVHVVSSTTTTEGDNNSDDSGVKVKLVWKINEDTK